MTEIVLNRFRGELTMLDGAGGTRGASGPPMEGGYDECYGGSFGDEPAAAAAPARARTPVNDLDDDIPF